MNRSAQWVIEGNRGGWITLTEYFIRESEHKLYQLKAYRYPMKRRPLHFVLRALEYLHKAYPYWQMRLRNVRDGDIIPMEAFGFGIADSIFQEHMASAGMAQTIAPAGPAVSSSYTLIKGIGQP